MPRRKLPHKIEVLHFGCDPSVPLENQWSIYTRLSDRQDDPESVSHELQEKAARALIARHKGVITAIYRDWRTGMDPKRRGFKELADDARAGKHGNVAFFDQTRLYRGPVGVFPIAQLHHDLPSYGFAAAEGGFDINNAEIYAYTSRIELENTRRRTMETRRYKAAQGEMMNGKKPYWIARDPETKTGVLIEERAAAMRSAIAQYGARTPAREVVAWMNVHAPRDEAHPLWTSERLRKALRNPALWGQLDYARTQEVTERRGDEIFVVGRKRSRHAVSFTVPPLIHHTELERSECRAHRGCALDELPAGDTLDELIRNNSSSTAGRPYKRPHPLRRRVVCVHGWRMNYRPRRSRTDGAELEHGTLTCARFKHSGNLRVPDGSPKCPTHLVSTRLLWPQVQALVEDALDHPQRVVAEVQAEILRETSEQVHSAEQEAGTLDRLSEELLELAARENRLYERWDSGQISKEVYDGQSAAIAARRRMAEEEKRQLLDRRVILERAVRTTDVLLAGLRDAGAADRSRFTLADWTVLLEKLVSDVVLDEGGVPRLRWRREPAVDSAVTTHARTDGSR